MALAYSLLKEARAGIPIETSQQGMQISEKIWAAFAQATKAFKAWRTERGYYSLIGELYSKYPQYKEAIREAHVIARFLHSDGFYEGIAYPTEEDILSVEKGIKAIESTLKITPAQ